MYATLVYNASAAAAGATNVDFTAASDPDFSQRNNHYIFTEQYRMMQAAVVGASVTRGRFQVPTWNAIGEFVLFNANRSLQPPSNPQWDLYYSRPPRIPINEEFQVQVSNNLGAATEIENVVLNIMPDNWSMALPGGSRLTIRIRATATLTPTLNAWSGANALSFSQSLRGGTYAVIGGKAQGSNSVAWRLIFPRSALYNGRKLRPGGLIQNAIGDVTDQVIPSGWMYNGVWGLFHTFEPVQIEFFGTAAVNTTYQVFLDLAYLGEDPSQQILNQWAATGQIALAS